MVKIPLSSIIHAGIIVCLIVPGEIVLIDLVQNVLLGQLPVHGLLVAPQLEDALLQAGGRGGGLLEAAPRLGVARRQPRGLARPGPGVGEVVVVVCADDGDGVADLVPAQRGLGGHEGGHLLVHPQQLQQRRGRQHRAARRRHQQRVEAELGRTVLLLQML